MDVGPQNRDVRYIGGSQYREPTIVLFPQNTNTLIKRLTKTF